MRTLRFDFSVPKILATRSLRPIWPGVIWSPLSPTRALDIPDAALPGPLWIRVRNRQTGICASDLSLLLVKGGPRISVAALPGFSRFYLGHEVVSEITEVGPAVEGLVVGDRVVLDTTIFGPTCQSQEITPPCRHCADGNYALCENQSAQAGPERVGGGWGDGYIAHQSEVFCVHEELTDDQAVLLEPCGVALRTVAREIPGPGNRVLVIGCGILGLLVCAIIRIASPDVRVTAIARYPHQASMAARMGALEVLSDHDTYREVARLTGAHLYEGPLANRNLLGGYDIVYDMIGSAKTINDSLRWARAGGTVVVAGIALDLVKVDLTPVWHQEVTLKGITGHEIDSWGGHRVKSLSLLGEWMLKGILPTEDLITHRYPFVEYRRAVASAQNKRAGAIKVVMRTDPGEAGTPAAG